ncbi:MAG: hypothetical protein PPHEMADE_2233 [uncultured Paraburkholderia sp.]|nr:MAG: hypothetical protein PPHEMADE_2233 [uncultured Paraburkholderia sp.]
MRLQGGAKFPTGAAVCRQRESASRRARERPQQCGFQRIESRRGVSRSGAKPEPTVTVRMEEDVQIVMFVSVAPLAGSGGARTPPESSSGAARRVFACLQCPETFLAQLLR